jgi:hypothetical protein
LNALLAFPRFGARQTGKTRLLRTLPLFESWFYPTLDDFDLRTQAMEEPEL